MLLLSWDCSSALLEQVENSKKQMIAHGVYGRKQMLSYRESQESEAGRDWGFFLRLDQSYLQGSISPWVPLKQSVGLVCCFSNWSARTTSGHTISVLPCPGRSVCWGAVWRENAH